MHVHLSGAASPPMKPGPGDLMTDDTSYGFTWQWVPDDDDEQTQERGHWRCILFVEAKVYPPSSALGAWMYDFPGLDRKQIFFRDWRLCFETIGYRIAKQIRRNPAE